MNKNKQLIINMSASFIAYIVTFAISFFLSPYIVKNVGVEAYGFVGLANNFISYAGLITIALNSMAGRFVTIKLYEKDIDGANKYFSSVFIANTILTAFMAVIAVLVLIFLEKLINVPTNIYWDVKILFAALFMNCLIGTIGSIFNVSTFATNKLYLNSARQIESNIIRAVLVALLFGFLTPRICYLGITSLVTGIYVILFNMHYTRKLTPELKIKKKYFDIKAIIELLSSGVWNLVTRLGQIFTDGLDLLITNMFISAASMGVLSLAKTIPSVITGIVGTLAGVFSPNFTILYAEKKTDELFIDLKRSIKLMGILTNIPIIILIVCGKLFFELWQPTQNAAELQMLSILTCGCVIFSGGINAIYNIFSVVNKLKFNAVIVLISGLVSTLITFALLKTTGLDLYAVAGVSTIVSVIRNLCFTAPYGAHCLKQKWYAFYPDICKPVLYVIISCLIGMLINKYVIFEGWIGLFVSGAVILIISLCIGLFIMLNKRERAYLYKKIRRIKSE